MSSRAAQDPVHQQVVDAAQQMERAGLTVGTAGNVSGRRADGAICITPSSTPYAEVTSDNLAVLSTGGEHVGGSGEPSIEKAMHLACYNAFAEVGGAVHCHAPHASMFAVARRPIPAGPSAAGPGCVRQTRSASAVPGRQAPPASGRRQCRPPGDRRPFRRRCQPLAIARRTARGGRHHRPSPCAHADRRSGPSIRLRSITRRRCRCRGAIPGSSRDGRGCES